MGATLKDILREFIIKMNYYNKIVGVGALTDKLFDGEHDKVNDIANLLDSLSKITIPSANTLLEKKDKLHSIVPDIVLYKSDDVANNENYKRIVKLFEDVTDDTRIDEKFKKAPNPLLFLVLDISVHNFSSEHILTNDLKKVNHTAVTGKKPLPLLLTKKEKKREGEGKGDVESMKKEMQAKYEELTTKTSALKENPIFVLIRSTAWKNKADEHPNVETFFNDIVENLHLEDKMNEAMSYIKINWILGEKVKGKYAVTDDLMAELIADGGEQPTGYMVRIGEIFKFFEDYKKNYSHYEQKRLAKFCSNIADLKAILADEQFAKYEKVSLAERNQFNKELAEFNKLIDEFIELQDKFIDSYKNTFFKQAIDEFKKITDELEAEIAATPNIPENEAYIKELQKQITEGAAEIKKKLLTTTGAEPAKLSEAELEATKIAITEREANIKELDAKLATNPTDAEKKTMKAKLEKEVLFLKESLTAKIGGSIQKGGVADFNDEYDKFVALKDKILTLINSSDNPKKADYEANNNNHTKIMGYYDKFRTHIETIENHIKTYEGIVTAIREDKAPENAIKKTGIYNYVGILIDEFIEYAKTLDRLLDSIEVNMRNSEFNVYKYDYDKPLPEEQIPEIKIMVDAINPFLKNFKVLLDIEENKSILTITEANSWIFTLPKILKPLEQMGKTYTSTNLEFYNDLIDLFISRILLAQADRVFDPKNLLPIINIRSMITVYTTFLAIKFDINEENDDKKIVYDAVIGSLYSVLQNIIKNQLDDWAPDSNRQQFFDNKATNVQAFIKTIPLNKSYKETRNIFIQEFIKLLIVETGKAVEMNVMQFIVFSRIVLTAIFFISNYEISQANFNTLKINLLKFAAIAFGAWIGDTTTQITDLASASPEVNTVLKKIIKLVNKCCAPLETLTYENKNTLSKTYGVDPIKSTTVDPGTGAITPPPSASGGILEDTIAIEATFFTLLIFYASYDFGINDDIVTKFGSKFKDKKFDIKPFLLFDSEEFDIIREMKIKDSDLDPHVFDLAKESLQLFHVGSIGSLWDYSNGKLTILLKNMSLVNMYNELFKRKYNSNKLFLFECINALKCFKAYILEPKNSTIKFAMSTLKAIEILLVKLSFLLNSAFEPKFIPADSVVFTVTINKVETKYTINSPYEVTTHSTSSGGSSLLTARSAAEARAEAEAAGPRTPPPIRRGPPEVGVGGTTYLTGHDDARAYRMGSLDYLPLYHKKTENDDHVTRMHTTEIKLPIIPTKSSKTQSKERGTKKEPSVRRKKRASSRYTNKIKKY